MDDRQLIQRILAGEGAAERELYDAHVDRVYRLAYRMTGDEGLAEDYTQDTFVRVFDRLGSFRGEARLSTWLHTVAMSVVLNGLRKRKRIRDQELGMDDHENLDRGEQPADPVLKHRIHAAIDSLSDGMRAVFVMHDIEGFKHPEIAQALEIPVGTSKARLSRARAQLRGVLRGLPGLLKEAS